MNGKLSVATFPIVTTSVKLVDVAFHQMGDVNWDGYIDGTDVGLIQEAFGSKPGDSKWNPDCDLNGDGRIDMRDIGIALRNLGKEAPSLTSPFTQEFKAGKCVLIGEFLGTVHSAETEVVQDTEKRVLFIMGPMSTVFELK